MDPAGPGWYLNSNCLKPSDAVYVEAIHSGADILGLGITSAVADADFYPNGGNNQPGCPDLFCNHERAWELFAATVINDNFVANKCTNMKEVHANSCRGNVLNMGNDDIKKRGLVTNYKILSLLIPGLMSILITFFFSDPDYIE